LRQVAEDLGGVEPPRVGLDELVGWINVNVPTLRVVAPVSKRLACDDVGVGAMAPREQIIAALGER
jgi:phosphopantothenoylcysteine decarboxylase